MLQQELEQASRIAVEAGKQILKLYGTSIDVQSKGKAGPVTEADKKANAFLVGELRRLFPGDGVVAEESSDQSDALQKGRCWYVDPLDGTKEFIARNGEFAVMLGLAIEGVATLGVVYQPVKDKLYRGVVGSGGSLVVQGKAQPLQVSDAADTKGLRLVTSRSHRSADTDALIDKLGIEQEFRSGSVGLKIGMIAEQQVDLYVHMSSKSSMWDTCGPEAILRAAGGRFSTIAGEAFHYGGDDMRNWGGILACNAAAYDKVLPIVQAIATDRGFFHRG